MEQNDLLHTILVLAPSENDALVATQVLSDAGFLAVSVRSLPDLCKMMSEPIGAILLADESLDSRELPHLQGMLSRQESWSDIPIILMASQSGAVASDFFSASGNISLLERPFGRTTLIRAVDVAMRARKKQYEVRQLLEQQARAAQARDDFFATLSHELRTPLSVILGWIDIIRTKSGDSETLNYGLEIVERNARLQKGLIDDLLDISRIITGKLHVDFKPVDFADLVKSVVSGFEPASLDKSVSLEFTQSGGEGESFPVVGDEQRLQQAVSNLLSNALKFTPSGGKIRVNLENRGPLHVLSVEDTGRGIEPAFLPSIFDRLKQEDMSSTRTHGGLGLGLAITSHIVQAHRGTVTAHSDGRDKGATMKIILPRANVQQLPVTFMREKRPRPSLQGLKVLAVDDSPDILELLEIFLGNAKADVKLVASADEALIALEQFKPDVILSDIGMPEVDGYQLISRIRRRPDELGGKIPAIALTAYARDEERTKALRAGFQLHVSKPISSDELISAIASLSPERQATN